MTGGAAIKGAVSPGLEPVLDVFAANFEAGEELGARFTAIRDGETIVDLWAGWSDRDRQTPWTDETLCAVYSAGKAALSFLVARAVSDGRLRYDSPVAEVWPEFAAAGKGAVTLAMTLSHQAGLCGFEEPIPPEEWIDREAICARIAAMAPLWPPGSAFGYHPQTVGFIIGELLRRTTGRTVGAILREDYFSTGVDIHCGMDAAAIARAAFMTKPPRPPTHRKDSVFTEIAFLKPWSAAAKVSREAWMAAEIPASNMHATARALAEIVHPFTNDGRAATGARMLDSAAVEESLRIRIKGDDLVLPFSLAWAAGLMGNTNGHFGPNPAAFGHAGFGGACVVVDREERLSAAYTPCRMSPSLVGDERALRLLGALYAATRNGRRARPGHFSD